VNTTQPNTGFKSLLHMNFMGEPLGYGISSSTCVKSELIMWQCITRRLLSRISRQFFYENDCLLMYCGAELMECVQQKLPRKTLSTISRKKIEK